MIGFYHRLIWLITGKKPQPKKCNCGRNQDVDVFGNAVEYGKPYQRPIPMEQPSQDIAGTADIEHIVGSPRESKGLGDTIAKATSAVGIKPCNGCKKRQEALNKAFPYENNTDNSKRVADDTDSV